MRKLSLFLFFMVSIAVAQSSTPSSSQPDTISWHSVKEWGVEGRGWNDVKRYYDRLPSKAENYVRDKVWELSHHSAGMSCRFVTDAPEIQVRYVLLQSRLEMPHMPATGVSGVDFYTLLKDTGWRWIGTVQPTGQRVIATIIRGMNPENRLYQMNLPLYNGIDSLEIGITRGATFTPIPPRSEKPLVFYGTSIMHGACASRPGMAIPAILGRRLNLPVINLGFSGNGKMELEVGRLLAELDPRVFVLDCLPNLTPEETAQRTAPFIRLLRELRPSTPILLVEDRVFPNAVVLPDRMKGHHDRQEALRESYHQLVTSGVKNLYYLAGQELLGSDGEGTVDGSHPSDLGMMRYAEAYERVLRSILKEQ
jgi:lysophospholipase L1-like esterase